MSIHIPEASLIFMTISLIIAFGVPLALFLWLLLKKKAAVFPFFVGCGVMFLFAFLLEGLAHRVILGSAIGDIIQNQLWLYALYGGLMAGLFEETGRLIAFKTLLRRYSDKRISSLMYGAGHGGFEAIALAGVAMVSNLILAINVNSGNYEVLISDLPTEAAEQIRTAVQTLSETQPYLFLYSGIERISAITLHLSFSVMVWAAANRSGKMSFYFLAIGLHALVDCVTVLLSGSGVSATVLEIIIAALAIMIAVLTRRIWVSDSSGETAALSEKE